MPRIQSLIYLLSCLVLISFLSSCQRSKNIWDITEPGVTPGWITFKKDADVNPKTFFKDHAILLQLPPGNELVIVSEEKDELGMVHYRYNQLYKNIPVEHAEFIVHTKNDRALTANGNLAFDFQPSTVTPVISEEAAFEVVKQRVPSERYFREDNLVNDLDTLNKEPAQSSYRPKGKLIFAKKQDTHSDQWELAWVFKAYVVPFDRSREVYVRASDGAVLKELPLFPSCAAGSGDTTFRGNQQFNTKNTNNRFFPINDCNGNQLKAVLLDTSNKAVDVNDDDNNWTGNNRSLVTSYWALDIVYDYFRLVHNRNSFDNKNGNMTIFNDPNKGDNASGGGGTIFIGFGSTNSDNDDYNTVDIVGHEFGHNLVEQTAKLGTDATTEAAALNESFSDIFGQIVERWEEQNANPDWIIADDKGCTGPLIICRDLQNPKAFGHPDTYKGTNWMNTNIDPHVNGTVQNRWFYLLTDGGTGTNTETSTPYSITGIGIEKARKIVYRTLSAYLNANSDYKDAREGSIHAAEDIYGVNSQEVGQVIKAWCAVGLCAYTQPTGADRFDTPGGNPNPASPDNNNTLNGATPLGTGTFFEIGKTRWSNDPYPKMNVLELNIFPLDDIDYFKITPPSVQTPFGGRCAHFGYSFTFTNNVNAKIYSNGSVVDAFTNRAYFVVEGAQNLADFAIAISPAFPGQILNYNMEVSYYFDFDTDCYQAGPRQEWELLEDCIMCNVVRLSPGETVILDPGYRTQYKVPMENYMFYSEGGSNVDIPIEVLNGNFLQAQLVDKNGNVVATGRKSAGSNVVHLTAGQLAEGIYSVRFVGFGNGTQLKVGVPQ